jgi:vancomycin aglycone glucosyltransferase
MRILLSTYGSRGDVEPMAALAIALQALGAEAVVSAPGEDEFTGLLARAGVETAPAFMPVRQWIEEARNEPLPIPKLAARMVPAQYASLDAAAAGCDAIVATGLFPSVAAARLVAEARRLHYDMAAFCPLSLPSDHHAPVARPGRPHPPGVTDPRALWDLDVEDMDALFGEAVNAQRATVGLAPIANVRDHVFTRRPLLAADPVLWPWRSTGLCDPVQTGAWILRDARPLPAELEAFLAAGAPPVYVGFGSIALPSTRDAARAVIQTIRAQGRRFVLARGWADNTLEDDDLGDAFVIGEVNQQALFPRVAAVIHHGGAGTTTTAARAGAPQLIVPQIVDQPYWAARVAALGLGVAHDGPTPTAASLSAALATALSPESAARAAAAAPTIRADGATAAARRLVEAIERGGRG